MKLKGNQEISENLLKELTSTQRTPKLDIDEAQAFSRSPTVTWNKRVTRSRQTAIMELSCKIVNNFYP